MFRIKKVFAIFLTIAMVFAMGTTAFASEPSNVIYIDATTVPESEFEAIVLEAQDGINTVIISWEGATAIIAPIEDSTITPLFNLDKTYALEEDVWYYAGDDFPIFQYTLKVTNKTGNPGAIDIGITYPDYLPLTTQYYWGVNAGYYTELTLTTWRTSCLWFAASSVSGNYKISAKCS